MKFIESPEEKAGTHTQVTDPECEWNEYHKSLCGYFVTPRLQTSCKYVEYIISTFLLSFYITLFIP